jgi:hypothetical protein
MRLDYSIGSWNGSQDPACRQSADACQTFSGKFCILKHEIRRLLDQRDEVSAINFALPARRVREVLWECDASSHRFWP